MCVGGETLLDIATGEHSWQGLHCEKGHGEESHGMS